MILNAVAVIFPKSFGICDARVFIAADGTAVIELADPGVFGPNAKHGEELEAVGKAKWRFIRFPMDG